jgi:prepilin peptidase CpaA
MSWSDIMAISIALVACVFDLHSRRIPNLLTFGAAGAALAIAAATGGFAAARWSLAGWAVGLAIWLPIYALGGIGAGDVKLMAAIGACLGPAHTIPAALYAAIVGGVLASALAIAHGRARQTIANVQLLLVHWRVAGFTPHAQLTLVADHNAPRLAYAVPILAGTVVAQWLR